MTPLRRTRYTFGLLLPSLVWLSVFILVPLALLVVLSFAQRGPSGEVVWQATGKNYAGIFQPQMGSLVLRSVGVSALTTAICILLAYPFAFIAAKAPPVWQRRGLVFISIPLWTNLMLRLYGLILLLRSDGWVNGFLQASGLIVEPLALLYSPFATALGLAYNFLPFAVMPLFASASRVDWRWVEAAYDCGASPMQAFRLVLWPLTRSGLAAAILLLFIPSMSLFVVSDILGGGRQMLLGNWIQHQFLAARDWPAGAALSVAMLAAVALVWFVLKNRWRVMPEDSVVG